MHLCFVGLCVVCFSNSATVGNKTKNQILTLNSCRGTRVFMIDCFIGGKIVLGFLVGFFLFALKLLPAKYER